MHTQHTQHPHNTTVAFRSPKNTQNKAANIFDMHSHTPGSASSTKCKLCTCCAFLKTYREQLNIGIATVVQTWLSKLICSFAFITDDTKERFLTTVTCQTETLSLRRCFIVLHGDTQTDCRLTFFIFGTLQRGFRSTIFTGQTLTLSLRRCFIVWHGCKETVCRLIFFTFCTFLHNFTGRAWMYWLSWHLARSNIGCTSQDSQVRHRLFPISFPLTSQLVLVITMLFECNVWSALMKDC